MSWQAIRNNSELKAKLIDEELLANHCMSVFDIGCNAGQVSRLLSCHRFVVGIDQRLDFRGYNEPFSAGACFGEIQVDESFLRLVPSFDAVLLLSVHHQWHASLGTKAANELFKAVAQIPQKVLLVEFSAICSKYGFTNNEFRDNDEQSIREYAMSYLSSNLPPGYESVRFVGAVPEHVGVEPFRYMFSARRN